MLKLLCPVVVMYVEVAKLVRQMEDSVWSRCAAPLISSLCVCARESAQYFTERALVIEVMSVRFFWVFLSI
jgi:hypothetical protein